MMMSYTYTQMRARYTPYICVPIYYLNSYNKRLKNIIVLVLMIFILGLIY